MARGKNTITSEAEVLETKGTIEEAMNAPVQVAESVVEEKKEPVKKQPTKKVEREYADKDLISCRSLMSGYMNFFGKKTSIVYEFVGNGDYAQIEYQDLRAAMIARDPHLFSPMFIIEDEELLEKPEWAAVKKVYDNMYSTDDLSKILALPVYQMRRVVEQLPVGGKSALIALAKEGIDNKTFDSFNKIKALDELLGTELMLFITED